MFRNRGFIGALLGTLLLLVVLGAGAYMAYQAGFANGALTEGITLSEGIAPADGNTVIARGFHPYWGFGFFGIGRIFFGLFFFFIFFGLVKRLLFFPMWARHGRGYGPKGWKGKPGYGFWHDEDESEDDSSAENAEKSA